MFIRVSFRFPKSYPQSGVPDIDLERNPLVSMQNRAFMLRRLRGIRDRRRPCLEACLRFLLFADEDERDGIRIDSGSSNEEEDDDAQKGDGGRKSRDFTVSLLRNNKNLAEPRTSQGVFGPNGWYTIGLLSIYAKGQLRRAGMFLPRTAPNRAQSLERVIGFSSRNSSITRLSFRTEVIPIPYITI